MTRRLLTPDRAAELLGVTPRTVARWADRGQLWCTRTVGGDRRYDEVEVKQLARELAEERTP